MENLPFSLIVLCHHWEFFSPRGRVLKIIDKVWFLSIVTKGSIKYKLSPPTHDQHAVSSWNYTCQLYWTTRPWPEVCCTKIHHRCLQVLILPESDKTVESPAWRCRLLSWSNGIQNGCTTCPQNNAAICGFHRDVRGPILFLLAPEHHHNFTVLYVSKLFIHNGTLLWHTASFFIPV